MRMVLRFMALLLILVSSIGLVGCAVPGRQEHISREKAIEVALKEVDANLLAVREATFVAKYQLEGKETPVWRVAFQTKAEKSPQATYFVHAVTAKVVWMENPPNPGAGTYIGRERAIEIASKEVDAKTLAVKEATLVEKFQVDGKEVPAWRVDFVTKAEQKPQSSYFVHAVTGEVVWFKNANE
jgi:Zn-dependent metalloprotease